MIRRLFVLALCGCLAAVPAAFAAESATPVHQAGVAVSEDAQIERLLEIFRVREVLARSNAELEKSPGFTDIPLEQQECFKNIAGGESMVEEMRRHYREIYSDPTARGQVIAFMGSETGRRLIDRILGVASLEAAEPLSGMSEADLAALDRFAAMPGGRLFIGIQKRLTLLQEDSSRRLALQAVEECGQPR